MVGPHVHFNHGQVMSVNLQRGQPNVQIQRPGQCAFLEMVDDIVTAANCGEESVNLNAKVNTFVEHKKLKLSAKKCSNIHIGNKTTRNNCPKKFSDNEIMKESNKEKYLGDFLSTRANSKDTIETRKARGYSILSEISAMLKDVPMGNQRTNIGLQLRKAWFHNSCLANSEVWTGINNNDLNDLAIIDNKILRAITGSQSKVPVEMLFLETGQIPISHVISVRRIMYWHTILKRHNDELIFQIYMAMKETPLNGDWIKLLEEDLEKVGLSLEDENRVSNLTKSTFKKEIKKKITELSKFELECVKMSHEKVRTIIHQHLGKPEAYLTSGTFSNSQRSILFNLRSSCENSFRDNFHNLYQSVICQLCKLEPDTQKHALFCHVIKEHLNEEEQNILKVSTYEDIFDNLHTQLRITQLYQSIIRIKKRLLNQRDPEQAYLGTNSGPVG